MKPILLSVAGLHSFREMQTIHFDLLSDAGVFGIFGPTGSGKSSILDAMTLALFGSVGRAKMGTQGILNHAEKQLEVSFQFEIGQQGSRQVYRVDRRYARNDGLSIRNTYSRLVELDANGDVLAVLADKSSDVDREVVEILGLTEDDFMRAVVLPQGKFQEFLHLDGKRRREMLQRLFGLEQYGGVLTGKLNLRLQTVVSEYQSVQAHLDELGDASEEALQKSLERLAQCEQLEARAAEVYASTQQSYQSTAEMVGWQTELEEVTRAIAQHEAKATFMQHYQETLDRSTRAVAVIPLIEQLNQTKQSEQELRKRAAVLQESVRTLTEQKQQSETDYDTAVRLRREREPKLYGLQSKLEHARQQEQAIQRLQQEKAEAELAVQQKRTHVDRITHDIRVIEAEQHKLESTISDTSERSTKNTIMVDYRQSVLAAKGIADEYQLALQNQLNLQSELQQREADLAEAKAQLQAAETAWTESNQKTSDQSALLEQFKANCPMDETALSITENQLAHLNERALDLEALETGIERDKQDLEKAERTVTELNLSLEGLRAEIEACGARLQGLRERLLQVQLHDRRTMAIRLSSDLSSGEPCPVCGSTHHPHPASESIQAEVNDSETFETVATNLRNTEAELDALRRKETALVDEASAANARAQALRTTVEKQIEQTSTFRTALGEGLSTATTASVGEFRRIIDERLAAIHSQRTAVQTWRTQVDELTKAVNVLLDDSSSLLNQLTAAKTRVSSAEREVSKAEAAFEERKGITLRVQSELEQAKTRLGVQDIDSELASIKDKDQIAEDAQRQLATLRSKHKSVLEQLAEKRQEQNRFALDLTGLESKCVSCESQLQTALVDLNAITKGKPVAELELAVAKALKDLNDNEHAAKLRRDDLAARLSSAELERSQAEVLHVQSLETAQKLTEHLQVKLVEEHFATVEEALESRLSPEEFAERKAAIDAYHTERSELNGRRRNLKEKIGDRVVSPEAWSAIQEQMRSAEAATVQAKAEHATARNEHKDLEGKHERWKTYQTNRASLEKQLRYLNQLKEVLRGERLVEFLAQEQLTYVAKQASERLKRLTRDRYALEVGNDGGFIMRDDANGGVQRPVTSLSGGETFLTSLSLALSLSTQIQLRGKYPLEFFFLDEGFGTLDQELLDVVMSTLEQLHMERMTIGVISHVPELQQRLHRRLIVEPAEPAGRGTRVRMERA